MICLPEETSLYINNDKMEIIGKKTAEIFNKLGQSAIATGEFTLDK